MSAKVIIDFDAITAFWTLSENCQKFGKILDQDWNRLINSAGYKKYFEKESNQDFLKDAISSVYVEDYKAKYLNQEVRDLTNHLQKIESKKAELRAFEKTLKNDECAFNNALNLATSYLPAPIPIETINVSFLFFGFDARGYDTILFDLLFVLETYEVFELLLAHELHHKLRNMHTSFKLPNLSAPNYDILWILNQIHSEGIADQIDKATILKSTNPSFKSYRLSFKGFYDKIEDEVKLFNDTLTISDDPENSKECGKFIRENIKMSGHVLGFFMSNRIIEAFGKDVMLSVVYDLEEFFKIYNKSALKLNLEKLIFSDSVMALIEDVCKEYAY